MNKFLSATLLSSTLFLTNHSYAYTVENSLNGLYAITFPIIGQTFKVTNQNNILDDFSFYFYTSAPPTANYTYSAFIHEWDPTLKNIKGSALFTGNNLSVPTSRDVTTGASPKVTVQTNSLVLDDNKIYIAFISFDNYLSYLTFNSGTAISSNGDHEGYLGNYFQGNHPSFNPLSNFNANSISENLQFILNFSQWLITAQDTMASMQNNILGLNQIFTMQTDALESALPQKCSYFNNDNFCVSFTAKYAQANNSSDVDATSGIVNVAYKINPNFYVGGSLEQIVSDINYSDVSYRQKAPDVSIYTGWNQNDNGEGLNAHLAYRHSNGKVDITRDEVNSAEAGHGHSDLTSNAWYASVGNTFNIQNKTLVTPYLALRYSDIERKAYTENLSDAVTTPLSYDDLNRKTTTAIVGVEAVTALTPKVNLSGTVGYENDLDKKFSDYSATGVDGLTPLDFNDGYKNNRLFLSTGIDYNFAKNQNIGLNVSYRESAFTPSAVTSASVVYQTSF